MFYNIIDGLIELSLWTSFCAVMFYVHRLHLYIHVIKLSMNTQLLNLPSTHHHHKFYNDKYVTIVKILLFYIMFCMYGHVLEIFISDFIVHTLPVSL